MIFEDRRDAGRRLAELLAGFAEERPIVVALPRGGVPVAIEISRALGAPLEVLAVRKIGAPAEPEFGIGALAEGGTAVLDTASARSLGVTQQDLDRVVERESRRILDSVRLFRGGREALDVRGRTVIVVDDGVATGLTDLAAVRALRARGAARIVVAVPVGSAPGLDLLREEADEVVCHTVPPELKGVGLWYRDFAQVSDEEVLALLAEANGPAVVPARDRTAVALAEELAIEVGGIRLRGDLVVPLRARGLVIFAHGSGSSRHSPRNRAVAHRLQAAGLATLLIDLLAEHEEGRRDLVFDIPLLGARLEAVTRSVRDDPATRGLPIGYFGASTGAGAALRAAAAMSDDVRAVVSRGGRPDLAGDRLPMVRAATLLIVGSLDQEVLQLNLRAAERLVCPHRVEVVEGATHLFEEPGTLEAVAGLATGWFLDRLSVPSRPVVRATGG
jgi:putative phosphoribosyl transferase